MLVNSAHLKTHTLTVWMWMFCALQYVPSLVEVQEEEQFVPEAGKLMRGGERCRGGEEGGAAAQIWDQRVDSLVRRGEAELTLTLNGRWTFDTKLLRNQISLSVLRCTKSGLTLYINTVPCRWLTALSWCMETSGEAQRGGVRGERSQSFT